MDAREELKKVAQEIRLSLSTYVIPLGAWADRIEVIAASLDEETEPPVALVEALRKVSRTCELQARFIEINYPDAPMLDRNPVLKAFREHQRICDEALSAHKQEPTK